MFQTERRLVLVVAAAAVVLVAGHARSNASRNSIQLSTPGFISNPLDGVNSLPQVSSKREKLATGKLLVATPQLTGSLFSQSVVLLLDYNAGGAVGLILNQQTSLPIANLIVGVDGIENRSDRAFLGGPVSPANIAILIRGATPPPKSYRLMDEVHVSRSRLTLEDVLAKHTPSSRLHVYAGYTGWGPGQLDDEIERGDWWVAPADAELIFDEDPSRLWHKLFFEYGGVQVRRSSWVEVSALR